MESLSDENGFVSTESITINKPKQLAFSIQLGDDYIDSEGSEYLRTSKPNSELKTKTCEFSLPKIFGLTGVAVYSFNPDEYFKQGEYNENQEESGKENFKEKSK